MTETFYYPSAEVLAHANIQEYDQLYRYSIEQREQFWAEQAAHLSWFKPWDTVLDASNKPFYQWFVGGQINIVHNAIDRHLSGATRNKLAIIWESEKGAVRSFSYHALNREVCQFANVLKSMGVRKGDITDAKTVACLFWAEKILRAGW